LFIPAWSDDELVKNGTKNITRNKKESWRGRFKGTGCKIGYGARCIGRDFADDEQIKDCSKEDSYANVFAENMCRMPVHGQPF